MANGTEATWVDLVVKNNRKQFLKLELPEDGVEVWSLLVDGQPTRPKRSDDHVLVPLPTGSAERTSQVSLVLLRRGDEVQSLGTVRPSLPGFDVPISEAMWTVYLPRDARYRVVRIEGHDVLGEQGNNQPVSAAFHENGGTVGGLLAELLALPA